LAPIPSALTWKEPLAMNGDSADVNCRLLTFWHFGSHHVAGAKAADGLGAHATAAWET
jgi:hypothetical protein